MLASVLGGDVLRGEKTRIAGSLESGQEEQHLRIWMELRAKVHGRPEPEERRRVEEKRIRLVDAAIARVNEFCVRPGSDSTEALEQVHVVLDELDKAQALYPTLKAFYLDKPAALDRGFQARCDTLITWATVLASLRTQLARLRTWTGSDTLDVTEPTGDPTEPTAAEITTPGSNNGNGNGTPGERTSFVDRVLKEDSAQRTFEKGFLTTVHALIGNARDAQVNLAPFFAQMALPTFEPELVPLISFPTRLVQAILRVRLDYATKLRDRTNCG
jgi:mitogen-activated protein kinase kinase kinase